MGEGWRLGTTARACAVMAAAIAGARARARAVEGGKGRDARDAEASGGEGEATREEETASTTTVSRSGSVPEFDEVRAMYHDAMNTLSTLDGDQGYDVATRAFGRIANLAKERGDKNLECEAALIVAEIEINSLRRMYAVYERDAVHDGIDASQFERITQTTLKLAYDNGDKISEARAHLAVGDYYSMAVNDHVAALEHYGLAREFARDEGILPVETEACRRMRWTQSIRGDVDGAVALSREVLRLTREYVAMLNDEKESSKRDATVPLMLREHWYLGGYENQEVYALKEHGCTLRGETRLLSRPLVLEKYQDEAVRTFEEAIATLDSHWKRSESSFETDAEGAAIKLSLLAHLGDILDNDLERTPENHASAVEYRRTYNELKPGSFGSNVTCALCEEPLGGLSIDDARIQMTYAWDACESSHHFHSACLEAAFDETAHAGCPGCKAEIQSTATSN